MALFDTLSKRIQERQAAPSQTAGMAQAAGVLSGKAGTTPAGPISNVGERVANAAATAKLQEIQSNAISAANQISQGEQNLGVAEEQSRAGVQLREQAGAQQAAQQMQSTQTQQAQAAADAELKQAKLDTARTILLQTDSVKRNQLKMDSAAKKAGVRQYSDARVGMAKQKALDMSQLLGTELNYNELLAADSRQFDATLARARMETEKKFAQMGLDAAEIQQIYSGLGGLASAGISAYDKAQSGDFDSEFQKSKDEGGTKGYQGSWRTDTKVNK